MNKKEIVDLVNNIKVCIDRVGLISILVEILNTEQTICINLGDIKKVLENKTKVRSITCQGKTALTALNEILTTLDLVHNHYLSMMVFVKGNKGMQLAELAKVTDQIRKLAGEKCDIIFGYKETNNQDAEISIITAK